MITMIQRRHIYIGGSKHGQVDETFGTSVVKVAMPSVLCRGNSFRAEYAPLPIETYELRRFVFDGTKLPLTYMVLASLSTAEAERLVEKFEAQPDETAQ